MKTAGTVNPVSGKKCSPTSGTAVGSTAGAWVPDGVAVPVIVPVGVGVAVKVVVVEGVEVVEVVACGEAVYVVWAVAVAVGVASGVWP
jgi:hypothetical protein